MLILENAIGLVIRIFVTRVTNQIAKYYLFSFILEMNRRRSKSRTKSKRKRTIRHSRRSESKGFELLVRSIDGANIPIIARDKAIRPNISQYWIPGVYTTYLSDKIDPDYLKEWAFLDWMGRFNIVLIFDKSALKDLPFAICDHMSYGLCIDPENSEQTNMIMNSKGKRKTQPDMTSLVEHINKTIRESYVIEKEKPKGLWNKFKQIWKDKEPEQVEYNRFVFSHEVIFDQIPLKYLKAIVVYDRKYIKAIKSYLPRVPVILMPKPGNESEQDYIQRTVFPALKQLDK
jgi:hypothetical protein